jgi:hypothetical protein
MLLVLPPLLFGLSFLSGMLGLGVAFVAKSATLSRIFAVALVALAVQRAWILLS